MLKIPKSLTMGGLTHTIGKLVNLLGQKHNYWRITSFRSDPEKINKSIDLEHVI